MGHDVRYHDLHEHIGRPSRFLYTPVLSDLEQAVLRPRYNRRLIALIKAWKPDLVFVFKGLELHVSTLARLRQLANRPLLINWNPDNPFDDSPSNTSRQLKKSIAHYDVYFIWDRDLFKPLQEAGAGQVEYLPFGYDASLHRPINLTAKEQTDLHSQICFVGNYTPERAEMLARLGRSHKLNIWGVNWKERLPGSDPLRETLRGGWTYGEAMSRVFGAADIVMNFIRAQNGDSHNMRTFEAPAAGAFMLSTRTRDQLTWLPEKVGAAYFADPDEMEAQAAYYLAHPGERQQIAAEGHRLITQGGHTYYDRMRQLINVVESF
jgi:spore maturation protein CgeB